MICPVCGSGTNSNGKSFDSYGAIALHVAGKLIGGVREHRIWVRKHVPEFDPTKWSKKPLTFSNMNALAELIYPAIELALDEAYESKNRASVTSSRPETLTSGHVADMARKLNRILDAIDSERGKYSESITARIKRLNWSGVLPRNVAALMYAIREYRNLAEHESKELSEADVQAIQASWKVIHDWASEADTLKEMIPADPWINR